MSAPATSALAMSPEYCSPPSPITGTPAGAQARAASKIAVTWGTPTPATTRVVQIEPGPTPTFTASTPASTSACAPGPRGDVAADDLHVGGRGVGLEPADHVQQQPGVAVRGVGDEHVDPGLDQGSSRAPRRRRRSRSRAPTRSRPSSSLVASGYFSVFTKSLTVIRPVRRPCGSTSGSFSILCLARMAAASSAAIPPER